VIDAKLLLTIVRLYVPGTNAVGSEAMIVWLAKETRVSFVFARVTVGAVPEGLKFCPEIVI
jgi:hypothetical protein